MKKTVVMLHSNQRSVEEMVEGVLGMPTSLTEKTRATCVVRKNLEQIEITLITRLIVDEEAVGQVGRDLLISTSNLTNKLLLGLEKLERHGKGVPAFSRVFHKARELGYIKNEDEEKSVA